MDKFDSCMPLTFRL